LELAYGHDFQQVKIDEDLLLGIYSPSEDKGQSVDDVEVVQQALEYPVDSPRLRDLVRPGQNVVIVTSDMTRPCPVEKILPLILDELTVAGVNDRDITVVVSLGLHRPMTEDELELLVGVEVHRRVRVINHDPDDVLTLGRTSRGTQVEIFRPVVEADFRICLGNIEFHYFAGYSGGAKAILPGCASRATITANHAMMIQADAAAGRIEGNPVRADIEEGAAMVKVNFILNVVVGSDHQIKAAVAGDVTTAHRRGCKLVSTWGKVITPQAADIVLVSAGGFPKDINLYQAQKALDNAAYAVRDGGVIILLAECSEGLGNSTFERWLRNASSPDDVMRKIQAEFILGGHKAAAVAAVLKRAQVFLVSTMPSALVEECGMKSYGEAGAALKDALAVRNDQATISVLPLGGSVLPIFP